MKWSKGMKRKCVNRRFTMDDIKVGTIFFGGYFDWEVTKIISGNHVAIQWTGFGTGDRKPSPNDMDGDFSLV